MTVKDGEEISSEEVSKHNTPADAWCSVHGNVYDVTNFSNVHPGGDLILLAAGKDASILFETYHPKGVPDAVLRKYRIGSIPKTDKQPASFYSWDSEFYKVLRERVVERLKTLHLSRRGGHEIWIKAVLLLVTFWTSMYFMCSLDPNGGAVVAAITVGLSAAFIGTCIQHDGNHGAFSNSRWMNKISGWTLDMIGASGTTWEIQHVLGHHPYTNLIEVQENQIKQESDPDVFSTYPMLRLHPWHVRRFYHRFQPFYAPLLFGLMTLSKVFTQDFKVAITRHLFQIDADCRYGDIKYLVRFWSMKVLSFLYMIAIPIYCQGYMQGFKLFLIAHFTCGELLATMFIVNHIIEGVSYAIKDNNEDARPRTIHGVAPMKPSERDVPSNDWAAVQCQTSVNWAVGSWFWNHFSGGLNHQIEHHLFPSICHTNYVYIQPVVESTCKEFGVPYQAETSLWTAYWKMLSHLHILGTRDFTEAWPTTKRTN
mmetsp:Transcript_15998/g.26142  ORF Transcript_15998/g.26142 Transcript_15998/m.26142 type:complete len:482 (+) Transcript_15998:50-1495(+)